MAHTELYRCPWHEEKTPSCCVNLITLRIHCFGCGREAPFDDFFRQMKRIDRHGEVIGRARQQLAASDEKLATAERHMLDAIRRLESL